MSTWRILVISALILGGWSAPLYGQPRGPMRGGGGMDGFGMMLPAVLRSVNLTPEQDAQVRQILASHRPAFTTLWQQLRGIQEAMADKLFAAGTVLPGDFTPMLQQSAQLREQLLQEALKVALDVRAVLTPEQLAKAAQVKDRLRALRAEERTLLEGQP